MIGSRGLVTVRSEDLVKLLRAIHRGQLACPITRTGLATAGLLRLGDELEHLRGHERPAVTAIVLAVLAERRVTPRS